MDQPNLHSPVVKSPGLDQCQQLHDTGAHCWHGGDDKGDSGEVGKLRHGADQRDEWRLRIAGDDLEDWSGEGGDGEEGVLGYVEGAGCEEEGEWEVDGGWVDWVAWQS